MVNKHSHIVDAIFRCLYNNTIRYSDTGGGGGMTVSEGQVVARRDSADLEREARRKEAELKAAEAALRDLEAGSRPQEIAAARATVARAQAEADRLARARVRASPPSSRDGRYL